MKVFVSGGFDLLHAGHIEFLNQSKFLGDYLVVCIPSDDALIKHKNKKPSLPLEHRKRLVESLKMVDEVVIGSDLEELGLNFKSEFLRIKPDILAVTEDDKYCEIKKQFCNLTGAKYVVLPKTLDIAPISTTEIINNIKIPKEVPLRVDFCGGWLDCPRFSQNNAYIINCTIIPKVSLDNWDYHKNSGLGGSGAYAILTGKNAIQSELDLNVGWQDPSVILETGLCVWRSGKKPILDFKLNPSFLYGKMALLWTNQEHTTNKLADLPRNYQLLAIASRIARTSLNPTNINLDKFYYAIDCNYDIQIQEGMKLLPKYNERSKKYCGGGHGGYALYLFKHNRDRDEFLKLPNTKLIEPYIREFE